MCDWYETLLRKSGTVPRVVPALVVDLLDHLFPSIKEGVQNFELDRSQAGSISAIVDLVSDIPSNLVVLDGADYARFRLALAEARAKVRLWEGGGPGPFPPLTGTRGLGGRQPLVVLRELLSSCPAESPTTNEAQFAFITDSKFRQLLVRDMNAVAEALANNEYKAVAVLGGSVVEALLVWALRQSGDDPLVRALERVAGKRGWTAKQTPSPRRLDRWHLNLMIPVARHLAIIGATAEAQAHQARSFRNFIHPAAEVRSRHECDINLARAVAAAVGFVGKDVAAWAKARSAS